MKSRLFFNSIQKNICHFDYSIYINGRKKTFKLQCAGFGIAINGIYTMNDLKELFKQIDEELIRKWSLIYLKNVDEIGQDLIYKTLIK
jgi:hypothetical protein|tara:strand:- start:283 stop:546 length:264 start_codon:yes stop_codon:yes gene_type:complete